MTSNLLEFLGILPSVVLVLTNIIKNNKDASILIGDIILKVVNEFSKEIPDESITLLNIHGVKVKVDDDKYKKLLLRFSEEFYTSYSSLAPHQKALFSLTVINILRNEIPGIKSAAEANSFVDIEKTLIRIIKNGMEIASDFRKK
jgi:hypothetical protein